MRVSNSIPQLRQQIHDDLRIQNPEWIEPNGDCPECDFYEARLMEELVGWQIGARFDFPHILYFQLAPTLYNYTGDGKDFSIHFSGDPNGNQTGINSLLVFDIPAEIGWQVGKIPMRIFGDFATNFDADDRATAAGHPGKGGDRYAYEIGLGIGQLKKKRDWQVRAWY